MYVAPFRRTRRIRLWHVLLTIVVTVLAAAGVVVANLGSSSCTGELALRVMVTPAVQPVVQNAANAFDNGRTAVNGLCVKVRVIAEGSADLVQALPTRPVDPPALWIPDSSLWTATAAKLNPRDHGPKVAGHPSLASSPLVMTTGVPQAATLGWPANPVSWQRFVDDKTTAAIANPVTNTEGSVTLGLLQATLADKGTTPAPEFAAALQRLRQSTLDAVSDGYDKMRQSPATAPLFTATEQSVIANNLTTASTSTVPTTIAATSTGAMAMLPAEGTVLFDFPAVRVTTSGEVDGTDEAAAAFEHELRSARSRSLFNSAGFRAPAEVESANWGKSGTPPLLAMPTESQLNAVTQQWGSPQLGAAATTGSVKPVVHAGPSPNLILDGDAEAAVCSSGYDEMTVPGWTVTSGAPDVLCYDNPDTTVVNASSPGARPGAGYFAGGTHGDGTLSQTVDVSSARSEIDKGTATYTLSGWLGGYSDQNDRAGVVATFLNSDNHPITTAQLGPVTASDRGDVTELLQRTATGRIPAGTRAIKVDLVITYDTGGMTDGYADDLSLTISPWVPAPTLRVPASAMPGYDHVFLVFMGNQNYSATSNTENGGKGIIGNPDAPYLNSLAKSNALLTNYTAATHNSDPNYLATGFGTTHSQTTASPYTTDCIDSCRYGGPNLASRTDEVGKSWKQYAEDANGNCDTVKYRRYHPDTVPFYYWDKMKDDRSYCQAHWQPLTQLTADLQSAATTPNFVWFGANSCNNMWLCSISQGDTWLQNTLPQITNSPAWTTQRSLLIITFDEDGDGGPGGFGPGETNHVATIVLGSQHSVKTGYQSATRYDHYSTARTIEQALGLKPMTNNDKYATPMNDVFS